MPSTESSLSAPLRPVVILFRRIGPYHRARINASMQRFRTNSVELTSADTTYAWEPLIAPELSSISVYSNGESLGSRRILSRRVRRILDELKPRAVAVPGWSEAFALSALEWCIANNTPAVIMSETQGIDFARRGWKEAVKTKLLGLYSAALVGGSSHVAYMESLGFQSDRIFTGYDVVDNDHFRQGADRARSDADNLRRLLDLPERYFLASSRFIEKKNLLGLLSAFAHFRSLTPRAGWKLVLLGDGPLKPQILAEASRLRLGSDLILPGFVQYDGLPAYYGLASAFIHASTTEQWGLVVNEAMASGLPVFISDRCGCARDLVQDGVNGHTFSPLQTETLAQLMLDLTADGAKRRQMGEASRRIISNWSTEYFAINLERAVSCVPRKSPSSLTASLLRLLTWVTKA